MNISSKEIKHKIEDNIEKIIFASRWILSPLYIILILVLFLILFKFISETINFISIMFTLDYNEWIMHILELLDLTLVANLVLIIELSGYENFISKIDVSEEHIDRATWIGRLDFSGLKLKIIGSVVAISLIELLQDFLNITSMNPDIEFWRIILHLTFVFTGVVFSGMEILSEKRHVMKQKEELILIEKNQFNDL